MDKKESNMNVLDLLLSREPKGLLEKEVKIKRLSEDCGADVIFILRGIGYSRIHEIFEATKDGELQVILEGVMSPDLKNPELLAKYSAVTPFELLKNPSFLLPGEIKKISNEILDLSGYRDDALEELEKN